MISAFIGETAGNRFFVSFERGHNDKKTLRYLEYLRRNEKWNFDSALLVYIMHGFFKMRIIEKDGSESDMCGNGVRFVSEILKYMGMDPPFFFKGRKGIAFGNVAENTSVFKTNKVRRIREEYLYSKKKKQCGTFVRYEVCGEPHLVAVVTDVYKFDINHWGMLASINFGSNLTVVSSDGGVLEIRTFERGVNAETISCGTGIVAAVFGFADRFNLKRNIFHILMNGHSFMVKKEKWVSLIGRRGSFCSLNVLNIHELVGEEEKR